MSNNSESWNQSNVVDFFNNHRVDVGDVYPSEWFFLKELLQCCTQQTQLRMCRTRQVVATDHV